MTHTALCLILIILMPSLTRCTSHGSATPQDAVTLYLAAVQQQSSAELIKIARNGGASQQGIEKIVSRTLLKYSGLRQANFQISYMPHPVTPNTVYITMRIEGQAFQDDIVLERYSDSWFWTPKVDPGDRPMQRTTIAQ
ncbi:MAG: hypothetical protein H0X37_20105 [Herpetosiphonaceae bacterium]|nr:hypothetical protein [Herpetosiphonaceae bacterium]